MVSFEMFCRVQQRLLRWRVLKAEFLMCLMDEKISKEGGVAKSQVIVPVEYRQSVVR